MDAHELEDNEYTRLKRGRRVIRILFVLIILNLIDLFYTIRQIVVTEGEFKDGNIFVQSLYEYFGHPDMIVLIKFAALAVFSTIIVFAREYYIAEIGAVFLCIIYFAVVLHWIVLF